MNIYFIVFGILLILGGFFGYTKAGSKPSLIAGTVSGLLILLGVYLHSLALIFIVSVLLVGAFIARLKKTKKFMPSGLLLVLSLISSVLSFLKLFT